VPDNWNSIELRYLRALSAVAETGTFWAASSLLNASLSTVSDHITALEALVGQRLVERSRGRRTVSLTEAGRLLLGHAQAIESRLRAAEADFRAYSAGLSGRLAVGIYQSVANKVLPEVMRRFTTQWPQVDVQLKESDYDNQLIEAVERGSLDLTFAIQPVPDGPFEVRELMQDPYVVITAAGSAMAGHRPRLADMGGVPMVGYQHGKHQDLAEDFLRNQGVRPRVVFRSNDNGTVQAMVASGLGFALSPLLAVDENDVRVRVQQPVEPVPPRVLVVLWHRDRYRPPAAAAFVDTAIDVAASIERVHSAFIASGSRSRTPTPGRRPRRSASPPA
jgi:molybdate transport repressor ModE-like protein